MARYHCILIDLDNTLLDFDAAEAAAPVDGRGVIQLHIHAAQCGQVDDGTIANALPYTAPDINGAEILGILHENGGLAPEGLDHLIHQPVGGEEIQDDPAYDNQGDKMRQIGNRLHNALVLGVPAKLAGWVCECGTVLGDDERVECGFCGRNCQRKAVPEIGRKEIREEVDEDEEVQQNFCDCPGFSGYWSNAGCGRIWR